ncbi:uncharacterized protein LACBIDRAFT_309137 [Laccaria bicolor S238N-H82]|uniref:Predicted protein n=1 Tax=Laccaria bicolor (strain S238N-H82 / ATCC MYA-4686) TaxID=486041 RepID=B0CVM8_LACBS|nr:uncharacterized protein LACBIDRAFT_309137 [Laccaria bicolor S238N-H82]EDR13361.1 predicted protein [Laccaria bicolor S238N-H82]|eukprot:XP_001875859.1 predicted protein [Laccaria bicolor S238N-H82]
MGGNAFNAVLAANAFPRIPPKVYRALKARLFPALVNLYSWVGVPMEAPEKANYGDLDFLVACPKASTSNEAVDIPHQTIQSVIGATFVNPMEGNRTSNYAVPVELGEWGSHGHAQEEEDSRRLADDGKIFYQVDVHVCTDKAEWDRVIFFHSYGDLGMILGLVGRNNGLALGVKGLKIPDPPNPPFPLSESFSEITQFLGLPMEVYNAGFKTKVEIFEWVALMKGFTPHQFRTEGAGISKVKADRKMYAEFVQWVQANTQTKPSEHGSREERQEKIRSEALAFFQKKEEFEALARARNDRQRLKEVFSGSRVREWAEMGERWKGVKAIMDAVRQRLGGEEGVLKFVTENGEEELRKVVLEVRDSLGLDVVSTDVGTLNTSSSSQFSITPAADSTEQ